MADPRAGTVRRPGAAGQIVPGETSAVVCRNDGHGPIFVDAVISTPRVAPWDLLVKVAAVGVNPVDWKQAQRVPAGGRQILGYDAAGTVVAVGDRVHRFSVGDQVYYAGSIDRPGCHAEYQAVDSRIVGHSPSELAPVQVAGLALVSITAWEALFDKLRLDHRSSGVLLVVGASGGAGAMAVQLARALCPRLTVVGTASRPETRARVQALGAHHVVDHHHLADEVRRVAPDGVRAVFSSYSEGRDRELAAILVPFGEVVAIDQPRSFDYSLLKDKCISWHWERMFARSQYETSDLGRQGEILDAVAELVVQGQVRPDIDRTVEGVTAQTVTAALAELHLLRSNGKVVLSREICQAAGR